MRRDPALPGLGTLLDPRAFAARLRAAHPGAEVGAAAATYVRYKPRTSCLVSYRVELRGTHHHVYAKAYGPKAEGKLDKRRERRGKRLVFDDLDVAVHLFPDDHQLPALAGLGDACARPRLLERIVPERPDLWSGEIVGIRYKPERRYVGRLGTAAGGTAALRLYAKSELRRAHAAAGAVASDRELVVPRLLGRSDGLRALALEWLPGRSLEDSLLDPRTEPDALAVVAAALARLHEQRPPEPRDARRVDETAAAVAAAADGVATVLPAVEARARELGRRLAARLAALTFVPRMIHGDFTADQVLLAGDTAGILDLDRAGPGHPAADLGSFLARLECDVMSGALDRNRAESFAGELVEAYRQRTSHASELPVDLYAAAALLRLAVEPFRRREPDWPDRTETILAAAELLASRRPVGRRRSRTARASPLDEFARLSLPAQDIERLGLPFAPLELRRAWPRSPGHVLLEYQAGAQVVAAQWLANPAIREQVARATERACTAPSVVLAETSGKRVVVQARGADRRLRGLAQLLMRPGASLVGHRAERRAVVRLEEASGVRYAKVVRLERVPGIVEAGRAAEQLAGAGFAAPELLEVDVAAGVVIWSEVLGTTLYDLAGSDRLVAGARAAGIALQALHGFAPATSAGRHTAAEEARWLGVWLDRLAFFAPEVGTTARRLAHGATAALLQAATAPVLLHRDFFDKQIVVDEDGCVGFLDFDTLATGEAALDVANMLAHLELRALQGRASADRAETAAAAFVEGYGPSPDVMRRCPAYVDATRLRLACLYAFRPASAHVVPALLSLVGQPPPGFPRERPAQSAEARVSFSSR